LNAEMKLNVSLGMVFSLIDGYRSYSL
jgi:hypothetical protein